MAIVSARAVAQLSSLDRPPPRLIGLAMLAGFSIFMAGFFSGLLVEAPPSFERCGGAQDMIGCLILSLD